MEYEIRPLNSLTRVCEILEISRPTIYRLVERKQLELVKIGAASRITGESLKRVISKGAPEAA